MIAQPSEAFDIQRIRCCLLSLIMGGEWTLRPHGQLDVKRTMGRQSMIAAKLLNRSQHLFCRSIVKAGTQSFKIDKKRLRLFLGNPPPPFSDQQ